MSPCNVCSLEKLIRAKIPNSSKPRQRELLELVNSGVWGPIRTVFKRGARYLLSFIDDVSNWVAVYSIKTKSNVFECFREYSSASERQKERELNLLQSDGGSEYIDAEFQNVLRVTGIHFRRSRLYLPLKTESLYK